MTSVHEAKGFDAVQREGVLWVLRLTSGEATEADVKALKLWRAQSPAHADALRQAMEHRAQLKAWGRSGTDAEILEFAPRAARPRPTLPTRRAVLGGALAASAVGGAMLVRPPLGLWPSLERVVADLGADYRTEIGRRRRVSIAQGVSVEMNTDTGLAKRPARQGAAVELIYGEIAVDAGGEAAAPFAVAALNGQSSGSNASFNVRYDDDGGVRVACLRGEIQVECKGRKVVLGSGRQVAYDQNGLGEARAVDVATVDAWRSGLLVFRNAPLSEVVAEINRYRPGKLILTNAELGQRPIFGVFHVDRLDDGIATLRGMANLRTRTLPGGIVLLG